MSPLCCLSPHCFAHEDALEEDSPTLKVDCRVEWKQRELLLLRLLVLCGLLRNIPFCEDPRDFPFCNILYCTGSNSRLSRPIRTQELPLDTLSRGSGALVAIAVGPFRTWKHHKEQHAKAESPAKTKSPSQKYPGHVRELNWFLLLLPVVLEEIKPLK